MHDLRLGDVARVDASDGAPLVMHGEHQVCRLGLGLVEEPQEHEHDELLRRVVVVVENDLVKAGLLDLGARLDGEIALAIGVLFLRVLGHAGQLA